MDVLTIKPESAGQTLASSLANRLKQQITSAVSYTHLRAHET